MNYDGVQINKVTNGYIVNATNLDILTKSQDNQIAIQLYEKAGYQTHHFFRIRELPQQINLVLNCDC